MVAESLRTFIRDKMRMAQIYQPVMLRTLLRNQGRASERSIAKEILQHDESQIEYYENTVRDMVGRVLRSHGLVERDRKTKQWTLNGFDDLSPTEVQELEDLLDENTHALHRTRAVIDRPLTPARSGTLLLLLWLASQLPQMG